MDVPPRGHRDDRHPARHAVASGGGAGAWAGSDPPAPSGARRRKTNMGLLDSLLGTGTGLRAGDRAPDFTLEDQDGRPVSLADFRGKRNVVVYFYPKDDTPGCTREACAFRDDYEAFQEAVAEVLGISSDTSESHRRFAAKH